MLRIKHVSERSGKSTAIHAKLLAPNYTQLYHFNRSSADTLNIQLEEQLKPSECVLLYPGKVRSHYLFPRGFLYIHKMCSFLSCSITHLPFTAWVFLHYLYFLLILLYGTTY
jgi:hypothetical protein